LQRLSWLYPLALKGSVEASSARRGRRGGAGLCCDHGLPSCGWGRGKAQCGRSI